MAPEEYALVHAIFGNALRAAPDAVRGAPPYHHAVAGPVPRLGADDQGRVVLWLAEVARPKVADESLERYDEILSLARRYLAGEKKNPALWRAASERRASTGALPIAQLVASALSSRPDNVHQVAGAAARRVIGLLEEDEMPRFLAELDHCILRVECQVAVDRYAGDPAPLVERVLWRADRGNGVAGHFLCSLVGSDDVGLITKMKRRWRWFRGPTDEMLATIPDDLFAAGVDTVLAT